MKGSKGKNLLTKSGGKSISGLPYGKSLIRSTADRGLVCRCKRSNREHGMRRAGERDRNLSW